jgi:hypothetical protein
MNQMDVLTYLIIFALSIIWSLTAINQKSAIFSFLAFITWLTEAATHLILAWDSNLMSIVYMYLGLALIFFVLGMGLGISQFLQGKKDKDFRGML